MKRINEYRVMCTTWYNNNGKKGEVKYYAQRKTSILRRWVNIKHLVCGFMDSSYETTYFDTAFDATEFCQNILCKGQPRQKWVDAVVSTSKCD